MTEDLKKISAEEIFDRWRGSLQYGASARRGELAKLRRVGLVDTEMGPQPDLAAALSITSFRDLLNRLLEHNYISQNNILYGHDNVLRALVAAITLSALRERDASFTEIGYLLSEPMSEPRFVKLMRTRTPADLLNDGRRVARLLKDKASPGKLGSALFYWNGQTRRDWAFHYYQKSFAIPKTKSSNS